MPIVEDSLIHNEYFGSDHCPIQLKLNLKKAASTEIQEEEEELKNEKVIKHKTNLSKTKKTQ